MSTRELVELFGNPIIVGPGGFLNRGRLGLSYTPEPDQALFDMASVFTNRLQRSSDIFSRLS